MSTYFEIAYATASHQLCLFTGTGFSKAITKNAAPSWQGLLETICEGIPNSADLKAALFPATGGSLTLEEAAQVIALELPKSGKDIYQEIANLITRIKLDGDNTDISSFFKENSFRIVTTNYDKLAEELSDPKECQSITPGMPIPRSQSKVKVFHVHGSIESPKNMVVTSNDYFQFINTESYFSRKLSTLLHENTFVILGYSLGDTNLKAIINNYKKFSRNQVISSNIFFISNSKIHQHIKDYYTYCYGIRVLDETEIHKFFRLVSAEMPAALDCASSTVENINKVLFNNMIYTENYLKVESSFFKIVASVGAIGRSINDPLAVAALERVIRKKLNLLARMVHGFNTNT